MSTIQLPGLIDVHTHLRVPGGEHKEDFTTGSAAALAGGVTQILGMPNTSPPLATPQVFAETIEKVAAGALCDIGLFAGASPKYVELLPQLADRAVALKIYLNDTFGDLRIDEVPVLARCFELWPRQKLIAMHAEKQSVAVGIGLAAAYDRPVHFCHISRQEEIELIATAKARGLPVTCEVTPHHLFLTEADAARLGPFGDMRPVLGSQTDVDALWDHIYTTIDCIATDHAPHSIAEKRSAKVPPGVPGLETSLAMMCTAVAAGRLTLQRVTELMATNPRRIFTIDPQPDTHIEVDLETSFTVANSRMHSKCGWTPFDGMRLVGAVQTVTLRGSVVYAAGKILAAPGSGRLIEN